MSGKLFIVSAPSGAGKTTLVRAVLDDFYSQFSINRVITYTSRPPRYGERSGEDYHFISSSEFEKKKNSHFFLEWSGRYDHYYGTPRYIIDGLANGNSCVLVIDRSGAQQIISIANDPSPILRNCVVPIWIYTSDILELERRLVCRGKNTEKQICRRIALAKAELKQEQQNPIYKHYILNDDFHKAKKRLMEVFVIELQK